jgi:secondary thiamine-phosphate synthase enzyme
MRTLVIPTERKTQLVDITAEVRQALRGQSGQVAVVFVPHTTAGVVLQASGEALPRSPPTSRRPSSESSTRDGTGSTPKRGDRNPWPHVRSALTGSSVTIPLDGGELALGDLQTILFCEFDGPRERKVYVSVTLIARPSGVFTGQLVKGVRLVQSKCARLPVHGAVRPATSEQAETHQCRV